MSVPLPPVMCCFNMYPPGETVPPPPPPTPSCCWPSLECILLGLYGNFGCGLDGSGVAIAVIMVEPEARLVCMLVAGECGRFAPTASCSGNSVGEEGAGTPEAGTVAYRSILPQNAIST